MYCSVMQCGAGSVLQGVAVCCSVCSVLQCVQVFHSVLQCAAVCCSALQRVAVCCSALQRVAVFNERGSVHTVVLKAIQR